MSRATTTDPHQYLDEIRENFRKIQGKSTVTDTENALFGMIDGLAGMLRVTNQRVTELERRVAELIRASR